MILTKRTMVEIKKVVIMNKHLCQENKYNDTGNDALLKPRPDIRRRKHDISSRFQLLSSPFPSAFSVFSLIIDLLSSPYYTNDSLSVYLSLSFHSFTPEFTLPVSRPSRILTINTFGSVTFFIVSWRI